MTNPRTQRRSAAEYAKALLGRALSIRPDVAELLLDAHADDLVAFFDLFGFQPSAPEDDGLVRVIPVHGALFADWGDYEWLAGRVERAMGDPNVGAVVLDFDSPGGSVAGMQGCARRLAEARGPKPLVSVATASATSAAYALASATDKVYAEKGALVGSIGVIATHRDLSKAREEMGVKVTEIVSGSQKNALSSNRPLSKDGRRLLDALVDESAAAFFELVEANRGLTIDTIQGFEGACFTATEGLANGLVDEVSTLDAVVQGLRDTVKGTASGIPVPGPRALTEEDGTMPTTTTTTPDSGAEAGSGASVVQLDEARNAGRTEAQTEERERVAAISDLCDLAGMPDRTVGFISAGTSVEDARKALVEAKAASAGPEITGARAAELDEETPLKPLSQVYAARARAMREN